jgi:Family of unknown function (DUF6093)
VPGLAVTLRGRRRAESLMVDTCEVREQATQGEFDPDTGTRPTIPGAVIYTGRCKVQTYEAHESTPASGQHVWSVQRYTIHLPATVEVGVDCIVTITSAALDEHLVGRRYRVAAFLRKSMATANRLAVDEVTE